ncbi:MAG: hypothetical protein B7X93_08840 [Hydrogenophilales bacterium 17-61-9]|nr:MAG: hypothetical protein B7X93_08840 [Hydrogenophilales bacterium 17-61-9]
MAQRHNPINDPINEISEQESEPLALSSNEDQEFAQTWFGHLGYGHSLSDLQQDDAYAYC